MEQSNPVVNSESLTTTTENPVAIEETTEDSNTPKPLSGDKTDPNLLLKSLREERAKVERLEEELKNKTSTLSENDVFSDEGKLLEGKIKTLESELSDLKAESSRKDVLITHPILKERWEEFEAFRTDPENKGMNMRTAAKAYLVENGLLDAQPRKGLERPSGGAKVIPQTGMTADEVKNLRTNNYKKYVEMLQKGQLNDIK